MRKNAIKNSGENLYDRAICDYLDRPDLYGKSLDNRVKISLPWQAKSADDAGIPVSYHAISTSSIRKKSNFLKAIPMKYHSKNCKITHHTVGRDT